MFPTSRHDVIIGSDIIGCSVAKVLLSSSSDVSVTVLEAKTLCSGASGRSGGHIKCVSVRDYLKLRTSLSHATAESILFTMAHYDSMPSLVEELGIQEVDEVRPVPTVTVVLGPENPNEFREAAYALKE